MDEHRNHTLSVQQVTLRYGRQAPVLEAASMHLDSSSVHLLIGRNGSGKSSLLRAMAGLQSIHSGRIEVDGTDMHTASHDERARRAAYVASTPPRSSQLRVGEVLQLAAAAGEDAHAMLSQLGEAGWWNRRLDSLSDGQAQRVMFARALLQRAPWVFLDEPTAFLDVPSKRVFWEQLQHAALRGQQLVLATHDYEYIAGQGLQGTVHGIRDRRIEALDPTGSAHDWTDWMGH